MNKVDTFFDTHPLTPRVYFWVGFSLSALGSAATHFWSGRPQSWLLAFPLLALFAWLIWLGPHYLQRYDRKRLLRLGTLAFFLPMLIHAFMLWLGQPGWLLDDFMGDLYMDNGAFLSVFVFAAVVYGLLALRMRLYSVVSVKRHSKKDLFQ